MQHDKIEAIKNQINEYENHIDTYWSSLNTEGVWLFLATLGCWSVNHAESQLFAIVIAVILFSYRIIVKISDKRSFPRIYK